MRFYDNNNAIHDTRLGMTVSDVAIGIKRKAKKIARKFSKKEPYDDLYYDYTDCDEDMFEEDDPMEFENAEEMIPEEVNEVEEATTTEPDYEPIDEPVDDESTDIEKEEFFKQLRGETEIPPADDEETIQTRTNPVTGKLEVIDKNTGAVLAAAPLPHIVDPDLQAILDETTEDETDEDE